MPDDEVAIEIRNGERTERVRVARSTLLDELSPAPSPAVADGTRTVEEALDRPIGCPPLEVLARGAERVLIVADDMTRPTPVATLLPPVLDRLARAGVPPSAIEILIATGTHREMTRAELDEKLGPGVADRLRVRSHRYEALDELVDLGTTEGGIPVSINRSVAEADVVIGLGNIVPHRYCGWAGGAKIIQPGVSGEATTAATHLMITRDPGARLGVVENRVRHDIEAVAERVGLTFIVNTVLTADFRIAAVVAGDFGAAFRQGVEIARGVYGAPFRAAADVVVASAHPSDINLWQAGKALYSADLVVRDGGAIILASPCVEGVGEHGSFSELVALDRAEIEARLAADAVPDRISAAAALAVALVRERAEVILVSSGIDAAEAGRMGMPNHGSIQAAVDAALSTRPGGRVTFMHAATELLPLGPSGA